MGPEHGHVEGVLSPCSADVRECCWGKERCFGLVCEGEDDVEDVEGEVVDVPRVMFDLEEGLFGGIVRGFCINRLESL